MTMTEVLQIVTGCIGSLGFAFLFNVRGKRVAIAALGGFLAWLIYVLLSYVIDNEPLNYFIVSFCVSVYAEVMARVMKSPTTAFITVSLIPLIPGSSLYYTMAYAFESNAVLFAEKAVYTLELAAALALGVIVATALAKLIFNRVLIKK